jgi:hypothetical protein
VGWLTDGRRVLNLLENVINQHWLWVSDSIPGRRNQDKRRSGKPQATSPKARKSPFHPTLTKGDERGIFFLLSVIFCLVPGPRSLLSLSLATAASSRYLLPVAWYWFSGEA